MDAFILKGVISLDHKGFDKGLTDAQSSFTRTGSLLKTGLGAIAKVGAVAIGAATTAVVGFAKSAVSTGMTFSQSMGEVQATMGATTEDMEKNVGSVDTAFGHFEGTLRDFAQFMGRNTAFTASEAAQALNYMALAGYDTQQSMDMLPNVLSLAAAGSMQLARASDMVTDAQTAFGIDAARTTQMVDEMAKAASTGNTSVEQLGDAFLRIGGLARELNGGMVTLSDGTQKPVDSLQELEIALTAMANAGVKGNEAGTHMRNMLLKLSSPTKDGAAAMEAMGVAVFDAEGQMRSLKDIFGDLNGALGQMTQQDKIKVISDLFNTRDMASAEALLAAVGQDWDRIGESILDAEGAAQQMADTKLDNLAGDITRLKSAWEGLQIAVSDMVTGSGGPLRSFAQFGIEAVGKLQEAFENGGLEGMTTALGGVLSDALNLIAGYIPDFVKAGINLLGALGKGILDNMDSILSILGEVGKYVLDTLVDATSDTSGVVAILTKLASAIGEAAPVLLQAFYDIANILFKGLAEALPELIPTLIETGLNLVITWLSNVDEFLAVAEAILVGIAQGLMNSIPILISKLPEIWNIIVTAVTVTIPEAFMSIGQAIIDAILAGLEQYFPGITMAFEGHMALAKSKIEEILYRIKDVIDGVIAWWSPFVSAIGNFLSAIWEAIVTRVETIKIMVGDFLESQKTRIDAFVITVKAIIDVLLKTIWNLLSGVITNIKNLVTLALNFIANIIKTVTAVMKGDWQGAWENIKNTVITAKDDLIRFVEGIKDGLVKVWTDIIETAKNWGRDMMQNIIEGIKDNPVTNAIEGVASGIKDRLHFTEPDIGPLADFHEWAPDMMKLFAQGIKENEDLVWKQLERSFDFSDVLANQNVSVAGGGSGIGVNNVVTMNIYPSAGMDEKALAREINHRLAEQTNRKQAAWRPVYA